MNIYPEDFEPATQLHIQQMRSLISGTIVGGGQYGFLGAMCGMASALFLNLWMNIGHGLDGGFFLVGVAGASLGYPLGFFADRRTRCKQRARKVTAQEISLVSKSEADPLRAEYFSLVSKLTSMPSLQDTAVEKAIRAAVRDIGSSIEKLPGQPATDLLLDAETFNVEASRLAAEANQENDPVVAASLQRQSIAQNQRAEAVLRNSTLARRSQVLRHEMMEHIKALLVMSSAVALEDNTCNLVELAENIQQVAIEAKSLTEARAEIDTLLSQPQISREEARAVRISVKG